MPVVVRPRPIWQLKTRAVPAASCASASPRAEEDVSQAAELYLQHDVGAASGGAGLLGRRFLDARRGENTQSVTSTVLQF